MMRANSSTDDGWSQPRRSGSTSHHQRATADGLQRCTCAAKPVAALEGIVQMTAFRRALIFVGAFALAQGCASPPKPVLPGSVTETLRGQLGTVGVRTPEVAPDAEFTTPLRGVGGSALKGGAAGGLYGAVQALSAGVSGGPLGVLVGLVLFIPVGIVIGATSAAFDAVPEETARTIEQQIVDSARSIPVQDSFRRRIVEISKGALKSPLIDLDGSSGTTDPTAALDHRSLEARRIDTVLEVGIDKLGMAGRGGADPNLSIFLIARAKLIQTATGSTLYERDQITYVSAPRRFSEWGENAGALVRPELDKAYTALARNLVDVIFLERRYD